MASRLGQAALFSQFSGRGLVVRHQQAILPTAGRQVSRIGGHTIASTKEPQEDVSSPLISLYPIVEITSKSAPIIPLQNSSSFPSPMGQIDLPK